jgi:very-short-patch-repair endonuclease
MGDMTRGLIEYARTHGGVITTAEALALGMSRSTLARRVDTGILTRTQRGVFLLAGTEEEHDSYLEAACRRLDAVVSHESAGRLHRFDGLPWVVPTVTVPHRQTHAFLGVVVHQSTDISDDHLVKRQGLPVTNSERTIIDLATVLTDRRLDWILDRALSSGIVDLDRLASLFSSIGRRGKPGTARVRRLLEKRGQTYQPPDSELEQHLLDIIVNADLPRPTPQFRPPWLVPTSGRVDFAYPEAKLIIEGDSRKWHMLMGSFETDRHRDNQAQLAGWRILRFTWKDITEDPLMVAASVRAALSS